MQACDLKPFTSQVTPQDPVTSNSVTILQQEIEAYLRRLKEAVCADLQALDERMTDLEQRVDACCGSS